MSDCHILPLPRLYDFLPPPDPEKDEAAKAVCGTVLPRYLIYLVQSSLKMFEPFQSVSKVIFTLLSQVLHIFHFRWECLNRPPLPTSFWELWWWKFFGWFEQKPSVKVIAQRHASHHPLTYQESFKIIPVQLDQLETAKSSRLACQAAAVGTSWNLGIGVVAQRAITW
jgi:hypothetical protein